MLSLQFRLWEEYRPHRLRRDGAEVGIREGKIVPIEQERRAQRVAGVRVRRVPVHRGQAVPASQEHQTEVLRQIGAGRRLRTRGKHRLIHGKVLRRDKAIAVNQHRNAQVAQLRGHKIVSVLRIHAKIQLQIERIIGVILQEELLRNVGV